MRRVRMVFITGSNAVPSFLVYHLASAVIHVNCFPRDQNFFTPNRLGCKVAAVYRPSEEGELYLRDSKRIYTHLPSIVFFSSLSFRYPRWRTSNLVSSFREIALHSDFFFFFTYFYAAFYDSQGYTRRSHLQPTNDVDNEKRSASSSRTISGYVKISHEFVDHCRIGYCNDSFINNWTTIETQLSTINW